jgi:hypothetical protein
MMRARVVLSMFVLGLTIAVALVPRSALAQAAPPAAPTADSSSAARAAELKKRGDESMDTGHPADAVAAYAQAYELTRDPALLYNHGRALEALGQYPEALAQIEKFDSAASPELKARVPGLGDLLTDLRSRVSTLAVSCDVSGAQVRLNDRTIGTTPLSAPLKVNAGHAVLEVTAEGYRPFRRELDLPRGGLAAIEAKLVSKVRSGVLVVESPVTGAEVVVDDTMVGKVPVEVPLDAGSHAVVVRHEGYDPTNTSAMVTAGERRTLTVSLEAQKTILQRWWFWTGVGVVVVGGVVLTYALLTERAADRGTIAPYQVSSGLIRF